MAAPIIHRIADVARLIKYAVKGESPPDYIQSALSGWGEVPQQGTSASMATIQGDLRAAEMGDTYYLFGLFRDMICNSSHVRTELGKRILATVGKPISVQPVDKNDEDDVAAYELCCDMVEHCDNWIWGMLHLQQAVAWPVAAVEKIYEPVDGSDQWKWSHPVRYRLKKLWGVNYALFNYRIAYWAMRQAGAGAGSYPLPITPGAINIPRMGFDGRDSSVLNWNPNDWQPDLRFYGVLPNGQINFDLAASYKPDRERHVIHRGNVNAGFRDTYGGELRSCLFWWLLATLGRDWFGSYMFRFGRPFIVAKANTADKNIVDYLKKVFDTSTTVAGGAVIVNRDAEILLKEAMVNGGADGFAKFIQVSNDEITKLFLGQILGTAPKNTGLGSGVAELQGDVKDDYRQFDNQTLCKTTVSQIFEPFLRINGYRGRVKASWGGLSRGESGMLTKEIATLKQGGLRPTEESHDYISQQLSYKIERDPDAMVKQLVGGGSGEGNGDE